MSHTKWVSTMRDGELVRFARKLLSKYPQAAISFQIAGQGVSINSEETSLVGLASKANGFSINHATFAWGQYYVRYLNNHDQSTPLAKLESNFNGNQQKFIGQEDFYFELMRFFAPPTSPDVADAPEADQAFRFRQMETWLSGAVERFEELQASFSQKNEELRKSHEILIEKLKADQQSELTAHLKTVAEKEEALRAAQAKLDDRSNTHARREIRTEIKREIAKALSEESSSKNTQNRRLWLRALYLIAIAIVGVATYYSLQSFNIAVASASSSAPWFAGLKASLSTLSLVGFLLLYLRWENYWLVQQSRYEATLASTKIDIDRASWIAESLLEWNKESPGSPIPNELLMSFARKLFDWESKGEDLNAASDTLASALLGSAAKLQIGPGGANVEFDRKSIKELAKTGG